MNKNLDDIYILDIIVDTTADGPGLRTAIYSAGCSHKCIGCHNPTSWNISNGKKMYINEVIEYITKLDRNITFSGGDPFFQVNAFTKLASVIKKRT